MGKWGGFSLFHRPWNPVIDANPVLDSLGCFDRTKFPPANDNWANFILTGREHMGSCCVKFLNNFLTLAPQALGFAFEHMRVLGELPPDFACPFARC
jgi:hypothetical protein